MTEEEWAAVAGGLGSFAGGLGDIIGAGSRITTQEGYKKTAQEDIDKFWEQYKGGELDARLDQKLLDAFSVGRQGLDINPSLAVQATSLDSAQNDPRMMAAVLPGLNTSATQGLQGLQQQEFQNELGSRMAEGQAYQGIKDANLALKQQIYGDKLTQDQAAYAQALGNIEEIKANRAKGYGNLIGGTVQTLGGFGLFGEDGVNIPEYQEGGDVMQQILASQGQEQGSVPPRQDLPGPESHEENPIDMVAPNGKKVGEATGGEIILNGEQTKNIEEAVELVDDVIKAGEEPTMNQLMGVYVAVSKTLSQPQFQDGPGEGSEEDVMRARMEMMLGEQQVA